MNSIPWYKSPVYVGIVTSLISQLLALAGRADLFPAEQINEFVAAVFQVVAIIMLGVAEIQRRRSKIQPITPTQSAANRANTPAS